MKHRTGNIFMILGSVLVMAALALFLYNSWDAKRAGEEALSVGDILKAEILPEGSETVPVTASLFHQLKLEKGEALNSEEEAFSAMPTVTADGRLYIGYLEISAVGLCLPVLSEWSMAGLKIAPGRYDGSVYTDNMIVAGHNYNSHFGLLSTLNLGDEVDFIDASGYRWRYRVSGQEVLEPTQIERMKTKEAGDNWDLTLFTCTPGGKARFTLRCQRIS